MMDGFVLLRPAWLLALLPLAIVLLRLRGGGSGPSPWEGVVDDHLLPHLLMAGGEGQSRRPLLLLGLAWLIVVLALAGPAWQRVPPVQFEPDVPPLLIALDLSRSMNARDLSPSRLKVAQAKLRELLQRLPQRPVALMAYSGKAHGVMPFTEDRRLIQRLLGYVDTGLMPAQGSRASAALAAGLEMFQAYAGGRRGEMLLVTDGVDIGVQVLAARLSDAGVRLSVYGVGTAKGAYVPDEESGYLLTETGPVLTVMESAPLRQLAERGGGVFQAVTGDDRDLDALLAAFGKAGLAQELGEEEGTKVWREGGPWLLLLLLPLASFLFRSGQLLILPLAVGLASMPVEAMEWETLWLNPDQRGLEAFERREFADAEQLFRDPLWRGIAQYQNRDYEAALESFGAVDSASGHYNRGNTLVKLERYLEALSAYNQALLLSPGMESALVNHTLVERAWRYRQLPDAPVPGIQPDKAAGKSGREEGRKIPSKTAEDLLDPPRPEDLKQPTGEAGEGLSRTGNAGGGAMLVRGGEHPETNESDTVGEGLTEGVPDPQGRDRVARRGVGETGGDPGSGREKELADNQMFAEGEKTEDDAPSAGRPEPSGEEASGDRFSGGEGDQEGREQQGPGTDSAAGPEIEQPLAPGGELGQYSEDEELVQAMRHWLDGIDDDPSELLKEKFRREYRRDRPVVPVKEAW